MLYKGQPQGQPLRLKLKLRLLKKHSQKVLYLFNERQARVIRHFKGKII